MNLQKLLSRTRRLKFETLESRELLSVTPEDYSFIRESYPDLNLSENSNDYNIIEVSASETALRNAIESAAGTTSHDLIVVRTTKDSHTITMKDKAFRFDAYAPKYGTLTIVSLGDERLTIDANRKDRVFTVTRGEIALGGLAMINGYTTFYGVLSILDREMPSLLNAFLKAIPVALVQQFMEIQTRLLSLFPIRSLQKT